MYRYNIPAVLRTSVVQISHSDSHNLHLFLSHSYIFGKGKCLVALEDLEDVDIALGPHLEEKTCGRFRSDDGFQPKPVTGFFL